MRLRRDTYLGAAAAVLAVSYCLTLSGWLKAVGFVLFSVAFLGQVDGRAKALRLAGSILAVTFVVTFAVQGIAIADRASLAFSLLAIGTTLLVAWAFAAGSEGGRRDRRLGWTAVAVGVGGLLLSLYEVVGLAVFDAIDRTEWAIQVGHFFFLALAGAAAATAFLGEAMTSVWPARRRVARREGYLALAAFWLALSYACELVLWAGTVDLLLVPAGLTRVAAGGLAVIGFTLSRRSLLEQDGAVEWSATTAGR